MWLIVLGVALTAAVWLTMNFSGLRLAWAKYQGRREVRAWMEATRDPSAPPGDLVFSNRREDQAMFVANGWAWDVGAAHTDGPHGFRSGEFAEMRTLVYGRGMIVIAVPGNVVYGGWHSPWGEFASDPPTAIQVSYLWRQSNGYPYFAMNSVFDRPPTAPNRLANGEQFDGNISGIMVPTDHPRDWFDGLRLYTGVPHPTDPSRFDLPFDSDHGSGRFEFDTDNRATLFGPDMPWPKITVVWDEPATTQADGSGTGISRD